MTPASRNTACGHQQQTMNGREKEREFEQKKKKKTKLPDIDVTNGKMVFSPDESTLALI